MHGDEADKMLRICISTLKYNRSNRICSKLSCQHWNKNPQYLQAFLSLYVHTCVHGHSAGQAPSWVRAGLGTLPRGGKSTAAEMWPWFESSPPEFWALGLQMPLESTARRRTSKSNESHGMSPPSSWLVMKPGYITRWAPGPIFNLVAWDYPSVRCDAPGKLR